MRSSRRLGSQDSEVRQRLIDAAIEIIEAEGCSAVTARRLAETVDLKRHIVHYYFGTLEDLFVAVLRHDESRTQSAFDAALERCNPLSIVGSSELPLPRRGFELVRLWLREPAILE